MTNSLKYQWKPEFAYSSLVVGWSGDAGNLGDAVANYLINNLSGRAFYEIDPADYFQLGGVTIENDMVQFPESKFYACPQHNLVIFKSTPPSYEYYQFFNHVLDIAEHRCNVKHIYTIGSMVSLNPHTVPRQILGTFSTVEAKIDLTSYDIDSSISYETTPGQKPALNSFFLWSSRKRNLVGVDLWVPVPFYLMSLPDPKSQKIILEFFDRRFQIGFDLREFDEEIIKQNRMINEVRNIYPDIDDCLERLENNITLSEDENMKLIKMIEEYIKGKPD